MSNVNLATSTVQAIKAISVDASLDEKVVRLVVDSFVTHIKACLKAEVPFMVRGLCRLHHKYVDRRTSQSKGNFYDDKVHREVVFSLTPDAKSELNGWVHDLGIKTNKKEELLKIRVRPEEIEKLRRRKTLEDQRTLGFRSELLFEESPAADISLEGTLCDSPSVEDIARRIGMNLND